MGLVHATAILVTGKSLKESLSRASTAAGFIVWIAGKITMGVELPIAGTLEKRLLEKC